jgi:hypothetical protein
MRSLTEREHHPRTADAVSPYSGPICSLSRGDRIRVPSPPERWELA